MARSSFATPSSWPATLATFAPFALAAMASTPQILSGGGGIDISIGPLLNLVSMIIVAVLIPHGLGERRQSRSRSHWASASASG